MKLHSKQEVLGTHFSKFYLPDAIQSEWPTQELLIAEKEA
jgi:hypothetical protein